MGSHTISDVRDVLDGIRHVVQKLRESSSSAEKSLGLSGAQLFVLSKLHGHEGLSINQLAELTATHQSSVSAVVSRLVERGLVVRRPANGDARKLCLSLTARGKKLAARAPDPAQDRLIAAVRTLSPSLRRQLARGLGEIVREMGGPSAPPSMFLEEARRGRRN
jgi:DNA-binding MarR family transcriptional regulator